MIWFSLFTIFIWLAGVAIGATVVADWLNEPRMPKQKPPTIPLARVIHGVTWMRMELPHTRRTQIPTVKEQP